ncbi:MAG: prephenate dehydrogenase/arogenate dehydrogenase family protein [Ignavibacteriales bacterium]|nr:prephenate dehydrogenase/arogenate dehydrogenase family protein [Ignavibacteriales bacterium]
MIISRIAIIGLGLIGGSFAKAIKHSDASIFISAYDKPDILNIALNEKVIDEGLKSINDSLNSDLIILALPIEQSLKVFKELSPRLKPNQIISDLCSVKGIFADEWKLISSAGRYFGAHPMTGKEKSGYDNSDLLLYENSVFIICSENENDEILNSYIDFIKLTGARIVLLDAHLHDRIIANVSHLPQLLSVLLMNQADNTMENVNLLDFAAGGFRDMTRIASSDFKIWESIIQYNKVDILKSLNSFQDQIFILQKLIEDEDYKSIENQFERARLARNEIPINTKGFIDRLFEITVFVKDEPGMISKISTILFKNSINIKDIELLKIREGTGGNFKFYFESESDADKAKLLIVKAGFNIQ